jgi:hypothetical protein
LSVFYLVSHTPLAYGGSCESMAGLAADVWGKFKQSALIAGCVLPGASRDVVTKFIACSAAKVQTGLVEGMLGWWNSTAQNRWTTIGARSVGPEWQEGTLRGTTGRTFTSMAPMYSRTIVELQQLDGKARTEITICGFDASGRAAKISERPLDPEQVKPQHVWRFPVAQAAGHILTIKLDAKSALNNFNYRMRTVTEPIRWNYEAKGFADLHVHQAAELAAAGNYYWGSHTDKAHEALPACHNLDPADLLRAFSGQESKDLHALPFSMQSPTVALDGSCRVNGACKVGTCTSVDGITAGKCVCTEDTHCGGDEYCAKGLGPLSTNQCKARLADGTACTGDHQCASRRCSPVRPGDLQVTGICYTPNAKAAGASCKIDLECRTGKCNSNKRCVCHDDGDCGTAMWCDKGFDLKENNCRAKLNEGEECGPAGINIGHRCKSGKCKLSWDTKLRCQ